MTAKGELRFWGLSDDGIFFLLFRRRGVQRKMDSDDSEPVGKNKHKIHPKKRKSKREKLLNSNSGKEEKKTKRAEEQTKQEQTLSFIGRLSAPGLRRWLTAAHHVLRDTALADVDAAFQQLAVNARCTTE
jgi:hypothetical protein